MARERQAKAAQAGATLDREYAAPAAYGGYAPPVHAAAHAAPMYQVPVAGPAHGYAGGYSGMGGEEGVHAEHEDEMVGCDNDDCPKPWWTLVSVGLTTETVPKGKWYCPECREHPDDYSIQRTWRGRKASRGSRAKPPKRMRRTR